MVISGAMYDGILQYMQGGVVVLDLQGYVRVFNPAAAHLLGVDSGHAIGQPFASLFFDHAANDDFSQAVLDAIYDPALQHARDLAFYREDGLIWLNVITSFLWASPAAGDAARKIGLVALFVDITQHKDAEQELRRNNQDLEERVRQRTQELADANHQLHERLAMQAEEQKQLSHLARHDALTGLPNRRLFGERLTDALAGAASFAIAYLDLDDFKSVNDTHGHEVGDWLIAAVVERLKTCLEPEDTLARVGGDEFALIIGDPKRAEAVMEAIIARVGEPYAYEDGTRLDIGASAGLALYPQAGDTVRSLIRAADAAMYDAKRAGRRTWRRAAARIDGELAG
ncbi:Uncharacterised protein [Starkeya nomas]|uniref:Uncharacterized protein n=1 Tax=Starkeya nomas TaxID=2666134 RepID=A0A5S9NDT1_9HYPH|nr:GGDEF domain-containing protein [Starkeya nomas]CAA0087502.1 Uncharacterised protein [Starkeya nomas]